MSQAPPLAAGPLELHARSPPPLSAALAAAVPASRVGDVGGQGAGSGVVPSAVTPRGVVSERAGVSQDETSILGESNAILAGVAIALVLLLLAAGCYLLHANFKGSTYRDALDDAAAAIDPALADVDDGEEV